MTATQGQLNLLHFSYLLLLRVPLRFQRKLRDGQILFKESHLGKRKRGVGAGGRRLTIFFCHIVPGCIIIELIASGFSSINGSMLWTPIKDVAQFEWSKSEERNLWPIFRDRREFRWQVKFLTAKIFDLSVRL